MTRLIRYLAVLCIVLLGGSSGVQLVGSRRCDVTGITNLVKGGTVSNWSVEFDATLDCPGNSHHGQSIHVDHQTSTTVYEKNGGWNAGAGPSTISLDVGTNHYDLAGDLRGKAHCGDTTCTFQLNGRMVDQSGTNTTAVLSTLPVFEKAEPHNLVSIQYLTFQLTIVD